MRPHVPQRDLSPAALSLNSKRRSRRSHPLQGYLRHPNGTGPSPAVVLLHSCSGNWRHIDERWGKRIASWGYAALSVDSFGPRGIKTTCKDVSLSTDFASDAYRALDFLAHNRLSIPRASPQSASRWAASSFCRRSNVVLRASVVKQVPRRGRVLPTLRRIKGDLTVPTLILIGERDDLNSAEECRNLVAGRDGWGISRQKDRAIPITLVVYPDAYHAFDAPARRSRRKFRVTISNSTNLQRIKRPWRSMSFSTRRSAESAGQ